MRPHSCRPQSVAHIHRAPGAWHRSRSSPPSPTTASSVAGEGFAKPFDAAPPYTLARRGAATRRPAVAHGIAHGSATSLPGAPWGSSPGCSLGRSRGFRMRWCCTRRPGRPNGSRQVPDVRPENPSGHISVVNSAPPPGGGATGGPDRHSGHDRTSNCEHGPVPGIGRKACVNLPQQCFEPAHGVLTEGQTVGSVRERAWPKSLICLVGAAGFEPATPSPPD